MNRITQHPILPCPEAPGLTFYFDGRPLRAREGDTIASALMDNGVRVFRHTAKGHVPRGLFCAIGQCTDCVMIVDGKPNVRTCITPVRDGMRVQTQDGVGGGKCENL